MLVFGIFCITCTYLGVRNVSFSENLAYVLNGQPLIHSDFLNNDMNLAVLKNPVLNNCSSYSCCFCAKACLSKGGLTRRSIRDQTQNIT